MRLEGRIYAGKDVLSLSVETVELQEGLPLTTCLDRALVKICHNLQLPSLNWLSKNTREFSRYRQTIFFPEQFNEPVNFSQFEIKLIERAN